MTTPTKNSHADNHNENQCKQEFKKLFFIQTVSLFLVAVPSALTTDVSVSLLFLNLFLFFLLSLRIYCCNPFPKEKFLSIPTLRQRRKMNGAIIPCAFRCE